ncbi:30150_t:CDS:2, partial [Gigaspora margarita]
ENVYTGDVKAKIKSFYDAIEHALQDTLLDIQKQEKLEHLKEMPEDAQAQLSKNSIMNCCNEHDSVEMFLNWFKILSK